MHLFLTVHILNSGRQSGPESVQCLEELALILKKYVKLGALLAVHTLCDTALYSLVVFTEMSNYYDHFRVLS